MFGMDIICDRCGIHYGIQHFFASSEANGNLISRSIETKITFNITIDEIIGL
jgi:hypothetical protein